ncbi:MAG: hypothetical protein HY529_05485 [Chloroflexi bacterium]|nr:hypothetical protein [Chloroflexota bacterium]
MLSACQNAPASTRAPKVTPAPQVQSEPVLKSVFGAVVSFNREARQMVVYDTISKSNLTLKVNDTIEVIQNGKKGNLIDVTVGSPVDVTYDETTMTAIKIIGGEPPPPQRPY